jgi:branched-chain amino acid transport system substrate-binding protein
MDWTVQTLQKAGPDLTSRRFMDALESTTFAPNKLGFNAMSYSKTKRLGTETVRISKLINGRWVPITDYISP